MNLPIIHSYPVDPALFSIACQRIRGGLQISDGIGTLSEKTIHAILKYYYAPDAQYHEQKVASFVADILIDGEITEIQTRNFNTMRKKLDCFLQNHIVTIVYPVCLHKWLRWIDPLTGEVSAKRRSPKVGTLYQIVPELYRIRSYLSHPHLHLIITFLDVEEYRNLDGYGPSRKIRSSRNDGFPTAIHYEIHISGRQDYPCFIPPDLPKVYSSKDFSKKARIPLRTSQTLLLILSDLEIVTRVGKQGNLLLYETTYNLD